MSTASPADQKLLLDVQAKESALRALLRRRAEVIADPRLPEARKVEAEAVAARDEAVAAREAADAAVSELEAKIAAVDAHVAKDERALLAGQAGSGTLQGLQREIENLGIRKGELEEAELEAMEEAEAAVAAAERAESAAAKATAATAELLAGLRVSLAQVDGEIGEAKAARAAAAAPVPAGLLSLYESTLERRGIGAARLFHGVSEGSGMALSPGDLAEIRRAAEDSVVLCPESGVILVRDPDWN